jgi:hypothetical protein
LGLQKKADTLADHIRQTPPGLSPRALERAVLPVLQLNLGFDHDGMMEQNAIMSIYGLPSQLKVVAKILRNKFFLEKM